MIGMTCYYNLYCGLQKNSLHSKSPNLPLKERVARNQCNLIRLSLLQFEFFSLLEDYNRFYSFLVFKHFCHPPEFSIDDWDRFSIISASGTLNKIHLSFRIALCKKSHTICILLSLSLMLFPSISVWRSFLRKGSRIRASIQ